MISLGRKSQKLKESRQVERMIKAQRDSNPRPRDHGAGVLPLRCNLNPDFYSLDAGQKLEWRRSSETR